MYNMLDRTSHTRRSSTDISFISSTEKMTKNRPPHPTTNLWMLEQKTGACMLTEVFYFSEILICFSQSCTVKSNIVNQLKISSMTKMKTEFDRSFFSQLNNY